MQALDKFTDNLKAQFDELGKKIRLKLFGTNNETLDFLMDSFYRLSPEHRAGVVFGGGVAAVFLVFGVLWFYFAQVDALERELNRSFNSLHELRALRAEYSEEQERYDRLISSISRKTGALRVKPFFEEKAQALAIELQGLNDQRMQMSIDNPLSQKMQYVKVDVRLPKISIPRLLNFLSEIEKSNNFLAVEDLTIRSRYGTKLYFDAEAKFRGYSVDSF